ncbi:DUF3105 domain-containing protein [Aquipuribacter hungaricus]|uniref:DUF3105 domain-containing protein n=1 Tax=Aquipuribacter hungaricus TaxID=545624 RepID=A0ABV7WLF3_9MICO
MSSSTFGDRQARLQQMQAAQSAQERRRSFLVIGVAVLVAALLIGTVVAVIVQSESQRQEVAGAAEQPIEGVQEFPDQSQEHVETAVDYPQSPPVGGDHLPVWQNCGYYAAPVPEGAGVHALEHGAVWVGYDPALATDQVETLRELSADNPYLLVSPVEDLEAPVVASAWGSQLAVEDVDDERLSVFLVKYLQGEQTPEPGAPCTGGING